MHNVKRIRTGLEALSARQARYDADLREYAKDQAEFASAEIQDAEKAKELIEGYGNLASEREAIQRELERHDPAFTAEMN